MFPSTTRAAAFDDTSQATALATAGALSGTITSGHCVSGNYETYTHDPNGNRTNLKKRDGRNIAFAYDALNRVTQKTYPQGGATSVFYGYDLRNLQLFARYTSPTGQGVTNSYDGFGRLATSSTNMGGTTRTLAHLYDRDGNRTRITHPDGVQFNYTYDGLDRPVFITDSNAAINYVYRTWGTSAGYGRIGASTGRYVTPDGRLTVLNQSNGPWGTMDVSWTFAHNPARQVTSQTRTNDAYAWTGHVTGSVANTINGLNQVTATGGTNVSHDTRGNVSAIGGSSYNYTPENRLSHGPNSSAFVYDPLGRLYFAGTASGDYLRSDGDTIVAELGSGAVLRRRYVHGPGIDEPLVWYEGSGTSTRRWFHADERGSVIAVSDGSGDVVTAINRYDDYGTPQGSLTGRFGYTGQAWLPDAGLYHYRARVYNPALGRFMQTDSIGYAGGLNLYAYVGNDPVNATDPWGLQGQGIEVIGRRPPGGEVCYQAACEFMHMQMVNLLPMLPELTAPRLTLASAEMGERQCPSVPANRPVGTRGQWGAALADPFGAMTANDLARWSNLLARGRFPTLSGRNDIRDAYRHFVWSFWMTRVLGEQRARNFGDAHEAEYPNNPPEEQEMDTFNNAVGRAMAVNPNFRNTSVAAAAEIAMRNNCLRRLR